MTIPFHPTWSRRAAQLVALSCVVALGAPLHAQSDRFHVAVGTRVRVVAIGNEPFTGSVLRLTSDTLAVAAGSGRALVQLPTTRLTSIEVSDGRDRLGWAVKGAGIGVLAGGILGSATLGREEPDGLARLAGFFAGGILGAGMGALVGAVAAPERWRRLSLSGLFR
jgi:hypothetical protein